MSSVTETGAIHSNRLYPMIDNCSPLQEIGEISLQRIQDERSRKEGNWDMLSIRTLRFLHRHLDDFVVVRKARNGALSMAELERILRDSGADAQEIQEVLSDYRRHRSELQTGGKQ